MTRTSHPSRRNFLRAAAATLATAALPLTGNDESTVYWTAWRGSTLYLNHIAELDESYQGLPATHAFFKAIYDTAYYDYALKRDQEIARDANDSPVYPLSYGLDGNLITKTDDSGKASLSTTEERWTDVLRFTEASRVTDQARWDELAKAISPEKASIKQRSEVLEAIERGINVAFRNNGKAAMAFIRANRDLLVDDRALYHYQYPLYDWPQPDKGIGEENLAAARAFTAERFQKRTQEEWLALAGLVPEIYVAQLFNALTCSKDYYADPLYALMATHKSVITQDLQKHGRSETDIRAIFEQQKASALGQPTPPELNSALQPVPPANVCTSYPSLLMGSNTFVID